VKINGLRIKDLGLKYSAFSNFRLILTIKER